MNTLMGYKLSEVQKTLIDQVFAMGFRGQAIYSEDPNTVVFKPTRGTRSVKVTYDYGRDMYNLTKMFMKDFQFTTEEVGLLCVEEMGEFLVRYAASREHC